jgi:formylglycine-generating enzyme required for sulfatase activity
MSPEQVKGVADIDIRSDIYALGATLFFLLTGTEPFSGETSFVITHRVLSEPPPDPRTLNQTVPPPVAALVAKALAKDRDKRYATPQELIEDLERARGGQRLLHAAAAPAAAAAAAPILGALPRKATTAATARVPTLDPFVLKLLALLVVGGVLGLGWWSMQGFTVKAPASSAVPAWAADGGKDTTGRWLTLGVGAARAKLRWCPPGVFRMGSPGLEPGRVEAESQHQVTLTHGFWIAESECAQDLYEAVVGSNPSTHKGPRLPVDSVSWHEATDFCAALAKRGIPARLPSEAEWEYACRAGSETPFSAKDPQAIGDGSALGWMATGGLLQAWRSASGDEAEEAAKRWCVQHADEAVLDTHPIATLAANAFGLFDLHGNVLEWCRDAWDGRSAYGLEARSDPESGEGGLSVARGGCWFFPPERCRSATRLGLPATSTLSYVGFRFVVTAP